MMKSVKKSEKTYFESYDCIYKNFANIYNKIEILSYVTILIEKLGVHELSKQSIQ